MRSRLAIQIWLLILPVLALFYAGLFVTIFLWYPDGLAQEEFNLHVTHFSIVYLLWLAVFFVYTLFDLPTFRSSSVLVSRLLVAIITCGVVAIIYFYFQPEFLLTPRRFLLVHLFVTTAGISFWYLFIQNLLPRIWQKKLYLHPQIFQQGLHEDVENFLFAHNMLGWQYSGKFIFSHNLVFQKTTVVLPKTVNLSKEELAQLFEYKRRGIEFLEYHRFIEHLHRRVDLTGLDDAWFLRSISYRSKPYDSVKRLIDILAGFIGVLVAVLFYLPIAILVKFSSQGPVLFTQERVGQYGKIFKLYKFRTMSGGPTDVWTQEKDARITNVGKVLRKTRLDELPQMWNILVGNMSLVGPRPEQVGIVEDLKQQIPYYDERHIVKPGLTGWSQLHVYANTLEGTRLKLQYDFYYIKYRSLWFDIEILLRTIFHIITLQGK